MHGIRKKKKICADCNDIDELIKEVASSSLVGPAQRVIPDSSL